MIAKVASALRPDFPLDVDALFHGSGNTRSALEALLAYTPHFFLCYPGRTDAYTGEILEGVKHIMWCPDDEHPPGELAYKEYSGVVADLEVQYSAINIETLEAEFENIETKRTHTRMQIAIAEIGYKLGLKTWIARNDQNIQYGSGTLLDIPGVVSSLEDLVALPTAQIRDAASLIDAIWYNPENHSIPAIFEVEHSTGVMPGLVRMSRLVERYGMAKSAKFIIVAPDSLKKKVVDEINRDIFDPLDANFLPYTAVQHLYAIMQKYENLPDYVSENFLFGFLESI